MEGPRGSGQIGLLTSVSGEPPPPRAWGPRPPACIVMDARTVTRALGHRKCPTPHPDLSGPASHGTFLLSHS